jgi:hypothetical protein
MASVPSTTSVNQNGWQQIRLQQAMRNADQAVQTAESLKAQANEAQRVAEQAQENAQSLVAQTEQAQLIAGEARLGVATLSTVVNSQGQVTGKIINTTA